MKMNEENMKSYRDRIEVFVEDGCRACTGVLAALAAAGIQVVIYDRNRDRTEFRARGVIICPATFINGVLVFYGEFTRAQLVAQLYGGADNVSSNTLL